MMLRGANVLLDPILGEVDARLAAAWMSDPAVLGEYFNVWPTAWQDWRMEPADLGKRSYGLYLIRLRTEGTPVGLIGYWRPYTLKTMYQAHELWWIGHPDHRGKGWFRQAVCVLINHLFASLPMARIQAHIVVGNEASVYVAERAGMHHEGVLRDITFLRGDFADMHLYAITRADWRDEASYQRKLSPF